MTCRKTFTIDLDAFSRDPEAPEWSAFRAHYPTCPDCSAELAIWDEMQALRHSGEPQAHGTHPPKELLLRYEEEPATLSEGERRELERHVRACHSCPDELAALRRFDFSVVQRRPVRVTAPARASLPALLDAIRGLVWRPTFAYAVAAVVVAAVAMHPRFASRGLVSERIARSVDATAGSATRVRDATAQPAERTADATEDRLASRGERGPQAAASPASEAGRIARGSVPLPTGREGGHGETRLAAVAKPAQDVPPRGSKEKRERVTEPPPAVAHDTPGSQVARGEHDVPIERQRERVEDDADLLADKEGSGDDGDPPRVLGLSGSEAPERDRWYRLALARGQAQEVNLADVATGVVLTLPPVAQLVDVRVSGPGADPAIGPLRIAPHRPIEIRLPAGKLHAGTYRVTIDPTDHASKDDYTFVVR